MRVVGGDGRACMAQADAILAWPALREASDEVSETVPSPAVSTVNLTPRGGPGHRTGDAVFRGRRGTEVHAIRRGVCGTVAGRGGKPAAAVGTDSGKTLTAATGAR